MIDEQAIVNTSFWFGEDKEIELTVLPMKTQDGYLCSLWNSSLDRMLCMNFTFTEIVLLQFDQDFGKFIARKVFN